MSPAHPRRRRRRRQSTQSPVAWVCFCEKGESTFYNDGIVSYSQRYVAAKVDSVTGRRILGRNSGGRRLLLRHVWAKWQPWEIRTLGFLYSGAFVLFCTPVLCTLSMPVYICMYMPVCLYACLYRLYRIVSVSYMHACAIDKIKVGCFNGLCELLGQQKVAMRRSFCPSQDYQPKR